MPAAGTNTILRDDWPRDAEDEFGQSYDVGLLGLQPPPTRLERKSLVEAIPAGVGATANMTRLIVDILGQIVTGERSAKEVGGPLRMAQVAGQRASLGWSDFVYLLAAFSINLGFINLLPVPMLDGGHLVFYAAEGIRGDRSASRHRIGHFEVVSHCYLRCCFSPPSMTWPHLACLNDLDA
jgi:RIP metalloprotease RseP